MLIFPHQGGDGGGVGFQTLEEQEVAVYFPHFLFEAPLASLPLLPPSRPADAGPRFEAQTLLLNLKMSQ